MLKDLTRVLLAVAAIAIISGTAQAGEMDKPVAARQAVMKLRGFYMGQLGAMAKGNMPYDAKKAQSAANSLANLNKIDASAMWPPGSGNDKLGDMTRAKPEIWSTYPEIGKKGKAYGMAVEGLVKTAGTGLDGLRGSIGNVGKACGGCHKPFRQKKN